MPNRTDKKVCEICKFSDSNEYDYGPWKTSEDCTIHYFCALLSTDGKTNGDDDEGIEGFLVKDIRDMCKAYTKTRCSYCPNKRATIRCCFPQCKRIFHVVCGIKNKCLNQFIDPFKSFCHKHVQIEEKSNKHAPDMLCHICTEPLGEYNVFTSIPSCCNYDYYHRTCMQKYGVEFGLLAKCPSCGNDAEGYRKFLSLRGIFCPIKDAEYELSENAYTSLLYVHKRCDANECRCPKGRDHIRSKGKWMYYRCYTCGGVGTHAECRDDDSTEQFSCRDCTEKYETIISMIDADEVNNSNTKPSKIEHMFDAEGAGKVWKTVCTNDPFKSVTLHLVNPDGEPDVNSLQEKLNLRQYRWDRWKCDFNSKPPPPPWLV